MIASYYNWFRAIHIIAVIHWISGMICLPLLYSYHAKITDNPGLDYSLQQIEKNLLRYLMNPAMIIVIVFGFINAYYYGISALGWWFHAKMLIVILLVIIHGFLASCRKAFIKHNNVYQAKFYLAVIKIVTISTTIAVTMVILKPFD